jgi:phosphoglycerate kinase
LYKPRQPLTAIIGGSKMESKIKKINNLIKRCTFLILGGGIANTFLKSKKINIGKSIYEKKQIKNAIDIQRLAKNRGCEIILPVDVIVSNKNKSIDIKDIKNNYKIFDVGVKTINVITNKINCSNTVIWSGPLGFFEKKPFDNATNKISNLINSKKRIISIAGGGDTIAAIKKNKKFKNFTFLSTGGTAFLSWLEKYTLPGIEVLKKN